MNINSILVEFVINKPPPPFIYLNHYTRIRMKVM